MLNSHLAIRILRVVGLSVTATMVSMLLAEGLLRIVDYPRETFNPWVKDEATGFRTAPNLRQRMAGREFDVTVETNPLGLRDRDIDIDGRGPRFRILLLGDSFTFGYGVQRTELFANLLEDRLGVEIVNAGAGGFELVHQVKWFANVGKHWKSDLVLYALYLGNDLSDNHFWSETANGGLTSPLLENLYLRPSGSTKIGSLMRILHLRLKLGTGEQEWTPTARCLAMTRKNLALEAKHSYALSQMLLNTLYKDVSSTRVPFFVIVLPFKTIVDSGAQERLRSSVVDLYEAYDLDRQARVVEEFCEERGIQWVNMIPAMREYYNKSGSKRPLFFYSDGHLTPAGHMIVADRVEPDLADVIANMP